MKRIALLLGGLAALTALMPDSVPAQPSEAVLTEFMADPLLFYADQRQEAIVECASWVLDGPQAEQYSWPQQRQALTTLAALYVSTGKVATARAACRTMLDADPCTDLDQSLRLPPPLVRTYYSLRDSILQTSERICPNELQTIAVGDIENDTNDPSLDSFCRGLSQILASDILDVTPLRVVDRVRLQVFMDEIGMSKGSEIRDPKFAVPAGKIMGAQSFVFGNLVRLDKKNVMLNLRWVNTSTTEILVAEMLETRMKSPRDVLELERKVLLDVLVPQINQLLGNAPENKEVEDKAKSYLESKKKAAGSSYLKYVVLTGDAVQATAQGDTEAAQKIWSAVSEINPADKVAKARSTALGAQVQLERS
jgi:TolB-like protein